jgi:predicted RNA-binding protein (virulence factor B family)
MNNINETIKIGHINTLEIASKNEYGYILKASEDKREVFFETGDELNIADTIELFVYTSQKGKLHGTREIPNTFVDEFNIFDIKQIKNDGVFLDWGISKDLFIPKRHQNTPFRIGENKILKVIYDTDMRQLVATENFHKTLLKRTKELKTNEKVSCMILSKIPHGFKVIVNNKYEANILNEDLEDQIFRIGTKFEGMVRKIRQDGSFIVKLKQGRSQKRTNVSHHIYKIVEKQGGEISCGLKSEPELIKSIFDLSKKSFKASALDLQEEGVIELGDDFIKVID